MEITHIPDDAPEMDFEFLTGDVNWEDYGGKWISPKLNNGDFDYWLVIDFINWLDATGETYDGDEYTVEITAVSPKEAKSTSELDNAINSMGMDDKWVEGAKEDPYHWNLICVEALHGYGTSANLWSESGNDADALLKKAKQAAWFVVSLFGFFMDTPQNRIGSTGWDFIKGDILAGLNLK